MIDAERYTLGACLVSADAMAEAAESLTVEDYSDGFHQAAWRVMLALHTNGQPVDFYMVLMRLRAAGLIDTDGEQYLANLAAPGTSRISEYIAAVKQTSTERHLYAAIEEARRVALDPARSLEEKVQIAQQRLADVALGVGRRHEMEFIGTLMQRRLDRIKRREVVHGIPTGIRDLDELTGGLERTALVILGSRTGVGKSSLGKQVAMHVAQHSGPVAFFSLEMSNEEIELRTSAELTGIDSTRIRRALLRQQEIEQFEAMVQRIGNAPLALDYLATTVPEMRRLALKLQAQAGRLALIVVDYIQLVKSEARSAYTRQQEIGQVTRALKLMAMEMDVPVLGLAQLNREAEKDEKPRMAHLREAGDIEQDANQIWLLHRTEAMGGRADLIVAKNRNGMTGDVPLIWHGPTMTYRPAYRGGDDDRD